MAGFTVRKGSQLLAAIAAGVMLWAPAAYAEPAFAKLAGTWNGSGRMQLEGGKTSGLRCRAYYTPKDGASELGLAIRCSAEASKIELRATLNARGGRVSGNWEERTYNASGAASGRASGNHINLKIRGGGFTGSMSVSIHGSRHSVSIQTDGIVLKSVKINLSRG